MKTKLKNQKGITLIALIITIIILVILAAVSIRAAYSSGIIDYSVNGTQKYVEGATREKNILGDLTKYTEKLLLTTETSIAWNDVLMNRPDLNNNEAAVYDLVIERLKQAGHEIEDITITASSVTEVNLDRNEVTMNRGDQDESISVTFQQSNATTTNYYIKLEGKYYDLDIVEGRAVIGEEEIDVDSIEQTIPANTEITHTSSNTNVVTTSKTGNSIILTAEGKGTATVTISCNGISKTVAVNVTNNVKTVEIAGDTEVTVGGSINLTATITPTGAEGNLSWTSQNGKVTIVTSGTQNTSAQITGTAAGDDVIIVRNAQNAQVGTYNITVATAPATPKFTIGGTEIEIGASAESLVANYGDIVDFTSVDGVTWQLFYDDENYVFLIASDYVSCSKLPCSGNTIGNTTYTDYNGLTTYATEYVEVTEDVWVEGYWSRRGRSRMGRWIL